ncbi:MAG TPA: histidine--tRNA ligase [Acidobacteriota bacterium]|nr:histidine--tRNA ligase [Acidobacteriota bacterium]
MTKSNTSPLSGTRDFLAIDVLKRAYVIKTIERVYQGFGFEPLETPAIERLETLLGKYGEEGDQLIFRIMKRGEKLTRVVESQPTEDRLADSGLRYDLTVPLARVAAEYQARLPRYFKRYQIQPVFRADRPAKGRFREFIQCDLDVVGSTCMTVEAEVLNAAAEVLNRLGFEGTSSFTIRLNHRAVLRSLMHVAGIDSQLEESALVAVDKLDKIGLDAVHAELIERGVPRASAAQLINRLKEAPEENAEMLGWLRALLTSSAEGLKGVADLENVLRYASSGAAAPHLRIDPYLARGLSYYTGPIFEVAVENYSGSVGGGGRYDDLIGMFSGRKIPACGFSLGLERILLIMEEQALFPTQLAGQPQVLLTLFDEETIPAVLELATRLRQSGIRVDVYPEPAKYGKQFKYADQRSIRWAVLMSPRELESGSLVVKDLVSGDQQEVEIGSVPEWLAERVI